MNLNRNTEISIASITDQTKRLILARNAGPGDIVCMAVPSTDEGWNKRPVLNGTLGVVMGFTQYEEHVPPINNFGRKPGVYLCNGSPIVRWELEDGKELLTTASAHDLVHMNPTKAADKRDKAWFDVYENEQYLRPLPELPFMELDNVRFKEDGKQYYIHSISYYDIDRCRDDGSPYPIYSLTAKGRGTFSVTADEIELVSRGNLWMWHNYRSKLFFETLEKEIAFHVSLGLCEQIKCPDTGNYHWPKESVFPHANAGLIDVIKFQNGLFGAPGIFIGYKLTDPDLSQRCNAALREGFSSKGNTQKTIDEIEKRQRSLFGRS